MTPDYGPGDSHPKDDTTLPAENYPEVNGCYQHKDEHNMIVRVDKVEDGIVYAREIYSNRPWTFGFNSWQPMQEYKLPHPKIGSFWKHSNGNTYEVVGIGNLEPGRQEEYPTTVWYKNLHTGAPYNRKLVDWYRSMKPQM